MVAIKSFRKERKLRPDEKGIEQIPLTRVTFDSHRSVCRRLFFLDNAATLEDLMNWKTNRFMNLGSREEPIYHIWADSRFAISFNWDGSDAYDVEIIDHGEKGFDF